MRSLIFKKRKSKDEKKIKIYFTCVFIPILKMSSLSFLYWDTSKDQNGLFTSRVNT